MPACGLCTRLPSIGVLLEVLCTGNKIDKSLFSDTKRFETQWNENVRDVVILCLEKNLAG